MDNGSPDERLAAFIAEYAPEIAELARAACDRMRALLPGAFQLVYDNYNALAIGFSPTQSSRNALFSIVLYPRWVSLFFLKGANLPDPDCVLKGSGKVVRHVVLKSAGDLDTEPIQELMTVALEGAAVPLDAAVPGELIIKVSPQ
jgi:hypothetical protein